MSMKPHKKAVCTVGKYTDNQGQEKKRYVNVGTLFKDDQEGRFSLKLDSIPVGQEWNGWVSFFDLEEKKQGEPTKQYGGRSQGSSVDEDSIPF